MTNGFLHCPPDYRPEAALGMTDIESPVAVFVDIRFGEIAIA
jgi:hypothetical protein